MREIGTEVRAASYLIADGSKFSSDLLKGAKTVGITAGASMPETLIDDLVDALKPIGPEAVSVLTKWKETIEFRLLPNWPWPDRAILISRPTMMPERKF